ncbi:hypothetical protein BGZ63DRAFT_393267 [Mariannaea sp. PMI_226]|nr:hypothetical protein BGZ63DRAFT_393267 [Mariannaea sp. PMI_226]
MSYTIDHIVQGTRVLKTSHQESHILGQLQDLCKRTTAATQASVTKQTFGQMRLDKSWGMQGIVGQAQRGVEQTFGDMDGTEHARGFQGQIDPASFAHMFTPQPRR